MMNFSNRHLTRTLFNFYSKSQRNFSSKLDKPEKIEKTEKVEKAESGSNRQPFHTLRHGRQSVKEKCSAASDNCIHT